MKIEFANVEEIVEYVMNNNALMELLYDLIDEEFYGDE